MTRRAISNVKYVLAGNVAQRGISIVRTVIVARLIAPMEFGLFALVTAILAGLEVTTRPGLYDALIQKQGDDPDAVHTVWTAMLIRSLLIAVLLFLVSAPLGAFFDAPRLVPLLRAMAVAPIIQGTASLSVVLEQRRINLAPLVGVNLASVFADALVSIGLALLLGNAWSLVIGSLVSAVIYTSSSYVIGSFRPRLNLDRKRLHELLSFGRWRFASNVLWYIATQVDDLVVGRLAGQAPLGLYRMAYRLGNVPTTEISGAIGNIAFPAFARKFETASATLGADYERYLRLSSGLAFFAAGMVAVTAVPLLQVMLGDEWLPAAAPLAILAIGGAIRAVVATGGFLFLGGGMPNLDTGMQAVRVATLTLTLILVVPFGIVGAAVASLLSTLATVPVWIYGLRRLDLPWDSLLRDVGRRMLPAVTAGIVAWWSQSPFTEAWVRLVVAVGSGTAVWVAFIAFVDPRFGREAWTTVREALSRRR